MKKLEILIRPISEYGNRSDVAIHSLAPSYKTLVGHIETAQKDGFTLIVIYTLYNKKESMFDIFASNSTWNKLRRDYGNVRCGEVGFKHGNSLGDGFTLYDI